MKVGIVGHEAAKFTPETEAQARSVIREVLAQATHVVSGGCHLGGIDIWAEEEADRMGLPKIVHLPQRLTWSGGYKERNLLIARDSDVLVNIVVTEYPPTYTGMRFDYCYHCHTKDHIKSGGCWTMKQAEKMGKQTELCVISTPAVPETRTGGER